MGRRVAAAVAVLVAALAPALASAATIRLGVGIPPWKLGMRFKQAPGLIRTERHPERAGSGCIGGPATATRIDWYPGRRLAWQNGRLTTVATTRRGDRNGRGFVIGRTHVRTVRRAHALGDFDRYGRRDRYRLGVRSVTVFQRTGYESWKTLVYWFDGRGILSAIEVGVGGC